MCCLIYIKYLLYNSGGEDYTPDTFSSSIQAGTQRVCFGVNTRDDDIAEDRNEFFSLIITYLDRAAVVLDGVLRTDVGIQNDDGEQYLEPLVLIVLSVLMVLDHYLVNYS